METTQLKRKIHLQKSALLFSLILFPPPPKINPQDPVFGTGSFMVEKEIPPRWQVNQTPTNFEP
jgi:hypothetical protein